MKARQPASAALSPAVIRILLSGWGAAAPAPDDGAFELFSAGLPGVVDLWRQHSTFLRAEAERLKIPPTSRVGGRMLYFGEAEALEAE